MGAVMFYDFWLRGDFDQEVDVTGVDGLSEDSG